jgi:MFS family permease
MFRRRTNDTIRVVTSVRDARGAAAALRFAALRTPDYRRYFALSSLASTADNIEHVISYWVMYQTFHSPALAGFAVVSHWVPFLMFSVWAGALADRYDCRKLIQISQGLFMIASLSWGLLFLTGTLQMWHAVVILSIHGMAGVIGAPAAQLIIHDMVGTRELASAIRLNASSRYLSILLGPAVGGGLMLLLGSAFGLLANVLIYLPFTLLLTRMPHTGHTHRGPGAPARLVGLAGAIQLLDEVRADRRLVTMIVLGGATSFFVGNAFQAQMPEYAHQLGTDNAGAWYSVLLGANASGAVIGAVLLETVHVLQPNAKIAIACAGVWGVIMAAFPRATTYGTAVTLLVLAGIANITFTSMAQTLVQSLAPARLRGRIVGLFNTAMLGLRAGSGVTVGLFGAVVGVSYSLTLSALAVVAVALVLYAREMRTVRARTNVNAFDVGGND